MELLNDWLQEADMPQLISNLDRTLTVFTVQNALKHVFSYTSKNCTFDQVSTTVKIIMFVNQRVYKLES